MELADNKYGGDDFPEPDASAFTQVLVDVPDVAGLSLDAAKQAIEAAGFVFEDGGQQDSDQPAGTVTGHRPVRPGRVAAPRSRVYTSNGTARRSARRHRQNALRRAEGRARRRPALRDEGRTAATRRASSRARTRRPAARRSAATRSP